MTKNELNLNEKWDLSRTALGWFAVSVAIGLLALGTKSYIETVHETARDERNLGLIEKLSELDRVDHMLRRLSAGETREVRLLLAMDLQTRLRDAQGSVTALDPTMQEFTGRICARVLRSKQMYPGAYAVVCQSTVSGESNSFGLVHVPVESAKSENN